MPALKQILLSLLFIPIFSLTSFGSHLMGGEITWTCLGTGQFVFNMVLYRDCNGIQAPLSLNLKVHYCPGLNTIPLNLKSQTDDSPVCNPAGPLITCDSAQNRGCWPNCGVPVEGAMSEYIYQSNPITISGTPPATGWIFTYDNCCRNGAVVNLAGAVGDTLGFTLRAKMFAYNGLNTNPCYDSSPEFFEKPRAVLCTGYPFTFNQNAVDPELDSLHFAWAEPLDNFNGSCGTLFTPACPPALAFAPGYSYTNPLPGTPAVLNPNTGEIKYTSLTQGYFVMVVEVSAYKCGTLVAQVYREIQVIFAACADIKPGEPNHPPQMVPPFPDSIGGHTTYIDTVYAGDLVDFFITTTDTDLTPANTYQNLSITASSPEFDQNFTNSNGVCLLPPCATLTPPPALLSGQKTLTTEFKWQTTCNHLGFAVGCANFSNVYNFVIKASDDFCPIPGTTLSTVTIVVLPPPPLPPPLLKCVAVAANGDVTISWVPKPDTAGRFHAFDIYYSQSQGGPYTLIDSVLNYAQTSYTHVGANANVTPVYYYMVDRSGCPNIINPSESSDTLKAIQLTVLNPGTGYADLSWNPTHVPPLSSNSLYYRIYKEYPAGVWTLLDSTQLFTYREAITLCSAFINYRIEVSDSSGCISVSTINGKLFHDIIAPVIPLMDSVSVDGAGLATMSWKQDSSGDVIGYIIYQCTGGPCVPIDTVNGINNLSFASSIDATSKSDSFCVAAFDSCGNTSPLSLVQNTIHLNAAFDACTNSATLFWNPFVNWPAGVKEYNIYASINGGAFNFIGSSVATTFVQDSLIPLSTYCYIIMALDGSNTETSSSNKVCVNATLIQPPLFQYVRKATVVSDNTAEIEAYVDTAADIVSYKIIRSVALGGPYDTVGIVPFTGNPFINFTDNNVPVGERSYYYKVIAVDSCGNNTFISQLGRTIHATATANDNLSNTVDWNDYEIWLGGVDHYNVYRNVDNIIGTTPITTVPFGKSNTFTDNISNLNYTDGKFCYYIEAVEGPGNTFGFVDTSFSNQACVVQNAMVFIPNAFHPDGTINPIFMPFSSFLDAQEFSFDIYNRWGERIFHSENPTIGWDGTYKGHDAAQGVYVYFAKMKGSDGTDIERKGSITLLR